jgi:hypothetical protein
VRFGRIHLTEDQVHLYLSGDAIVAQAPREAIHKATDIAVGFEINAPSEFLDSVLDERNPTSIQSLYQEAAGLAPIAGVLASVL